MTAIKTASLAKALKIAKQTAWQYDPGAVIIDDNNIAVTCNNQSWSFTAEFGSASGNNARFQVAPLALESLLPSAKETAIELDQSAARVTVGGMVLQAVATERLAGDSFPKGELRRIGAIAGKDLADLAAETLFAVGGPGDPRYTLTAVFMEGYGAAGGPGGVNFVTTDGCFLARASARLVDYSGLSKGILLPPKPLKIAAAALSRCQYVDIVESDSRVVFRGLEGDMKMTFTLSKEEGSFPDYQRVIPDFPALPPLVAGRLELIDILQAAAKFAKDKLVYVKAEGPRLTVGAKTDAGEFIKSLPVDYRGPFTIQAFGNIHKKLVPALKALEDETATIYLQSGAEPVVLEANSYLVVVMPMKYWPENWPDFCQPEETTAPAAPLAIPAPEAPQAGPEMDAPASVPAAAPAHAPALSETDVKPETLALLEAATSQGGGPILDDLDEDDLNIFWDNAQSMDGKSKIAVCGRFDIIFKFHISRAAKTKGDLIVTDVSVRGAIAA